MEWVLLIERQRKTNEDLFFNGIYEPAMIALCGSIIRSVIDVVRNEPKRVKDVPF